MLETDRLDNVMLDLEEGEEVDLDPVANPKKSEVEELDLSTKLESVSERFLRTGKGQKRTRRC